MKVVKIGLVGIAIAVAAIMLLLAIGIPSGWVNSLIQNRVARDIGYRITVDGPTKISLFPGLGVTLHDVSLQRPQQDDQDSRITIASLRAALPLRSVIAGHAQVTDLTLTRPVIHVPLLRDRGAPAAPDKNSAAEPQPRTISVDHVSIVDGAVVFANARDGVAQRIDGIDSEIRSAPEQRISATGKARFGDHSLGFAIKAATQGPARQPVPVELTLDAPDLLKSQLTAKAEIRLNDAMLQINGLSGMLGDEQFNGWASADLAGKPLLKLDVDFQQLDVAMTPAPPQPGEPWSDAPIDLSGLNYLDAQIRLSAADLKIGEARFAPALIDAKLTNGAMTAQFTDLGVYGGKADGALGIDVSTPTPSYTLRGDLKDVRALPLLSGLAEFDRLDGKMQAKIAVTASGGSQRAIMSALNGTAFVNFSDGEIRGLNVAKMIRTLTSSTLTGWQESSTEATDLSQLSASFQIDQGKATSSDLLLIGPLVRMTGAGTIDLTAKSLAFRVEPKLVMTTQGQGRSGDPVGFGIPVVVDGPWNAPRIFPDAAGILDNPDAAYARLRQLGQGLFGALGGQDASGSGALSGELGKTLGKLIQQGLDGQQPGGQTPDGREPRGIAPQNPAPQSETGPGAPTNPDDDAAMNAIMKRLFNR
ncbi:MULTISPECIES: AsmA family protein [Rhodopseudomonas]|uniref:Cell envelope biogenesis protein AsmA n=1 Tax=Rhodopseudomonas palustris TaxID=1076 RepID=A0A0D7EII1_RHOPL|nr:MULTISPECIES: AsmA family protein [Rhodopseudomonas]KIZ40461.1 cell envelope biogenesis protein AsmA [Rhodopseudomonas palustris]MDF3813412.1 AsmA family protein [Rhodopseudomonas sp. BAL398]WOK15976.1 AsmA family protein [Rhodopseudomonas sp. BAL398]